MVIDTKLNNEKITKDFNNLKEETEKLIDKYNKSVDSIKKQELAINKINEEIKKTMEFDKVPPAFESIEKESISLQKELNTIESQMKDLSTIKFNNEKEINAYEKWEASGNLWGQNWFDYADKWKEVKQIKENNEQINNDLANITERYNSLIVKKTEYDDKLNQAKKEYKEMTLSNLNSELEIANSKLKETKDNASILKNKIFDSLNESPTLKFGTGIDKLGKKIDKFKNKISRLIGTAMIFSLMRNQLTGLRNGFISLLKQNDDFNNGLGQIKANLMTAFAPIYNACLPAINSLMSSLSKLAGTIAMFTAGLFGTSIDDARKSAKGLSKDLNKVGSSAKNASGNLASFDNLEVIGSSNSSGGVDNSGVNYDTEISYNQKLLDILNAVKDFIVENKELILGFLSGIAFGILAIKLGVEGIEGLAFGTILAGIVILIQSIVEFIKDPSWDNFAKILQGLAILLTGVAIAMLAVNAANPVAWIILAIAMIVALVAVIIKNWDTVKNVLGSVGDWIYNHIIKPVADFFSGLWQGIKNGVNSSVQWVKDKFWSIIDFFNNLISKIVGFFKSLGTKVGNAIGSAFITVINGVLGAVENILNFPIKSINKLIKTINKVPGINLGTLPTFKLPRLASGAVIPPRHEFAAILGDQKHGTNIEAPLETIKQANREVMQEFLGTLSNLNDQEREIVLKNMTFVLQFGSSNFQKIVIDSIRLSEKELGKQLLLA